MIDRGLLSRTKQIMDARHPGVQLCDVLAVIDHESGGNPCFYGSEPLFRMNTNMALAWREDKQLIQSGANSNEIRAAMVIPAGALKGMWSKFRFEKAYWHDFAKPIAAKHPELKLTPAQIILLSCSVGLGQQMLRFVVEKLAPEKILPEAYRFMGDVGEQINWVIGNLQSHADADKQLMFARYNLASAKKDGAVYHTYGKVVSDHAIRIDAWLKEQKS